MSYDQLNSELARRTVDRITRAMDGVTFGESMDGLAHEYASVALRAVDGMGLSPDARRALHESVRLRSLALVQRVMSVSVESVAKHAFVSARIYLTPPPGVDTMGIPPVPLTQGTHA